MARGRMLNKTVSLSTKFAALPDDTCRLLATWTIPHLDKNGVFYGEAAIVRSLIFTLREDITTAKVETYLKAMERVGLMYRFTADGHTWQVWPGFSDNQPGLREERERSDYPLPPARENPATARENPATAGNTPAEVEVEVEREVEVEVEDSADAALPHPSSALKNPQIGSSTPLEANTVAAQTIAPDPPHTFEDTESTTTDPTPKKNRTRAPKTADADANPNHQALFAAIAECCHMDARLTGGRIGKAAKELWHAVHATPEQVSTFKAWWFANDWRGQKGSPPTLGQLSEFWQQAQDGAAAGNAIANAARKRESAGDIAIRRLAERYGNGQ